MRLLRLYRRYKEKYDQFSGLVRQMGGGPVQVFTHLICFLGNCLVYRISIIDYFELTFYKKTRAEKRTYINSHDQREFAHTVDVPEVGFEFTKKSVLHDLFREQMGRDQLFTETMTEEDFADFAARHERFLFKPDFSWCGRGIGIVETEGRSVHELYEELRQQNGILDELVVQHPDMEALHPGTLNTVRVFSFLLNGKLDIIAAALRVGRDGAVVDNYSAGGIVCSIDSATGRVIDRGEDMFGKRYESHPDSGVPLVGFQVPRWDEVLAFVEEVARISPIRYAGWDIAIRENDCVLIEGNYNPMVNVCQIAGADGKKARFEEMLALYHETVEKEKQPEAALC